MPLHRDAATGFEAGAGVYARGRPDYPAALDGWLGEALGIGPGSRVLDLGSGTGKFLPRLLARGAQVTAVEPVAAMRAQLQSAFPGVAVREGTAQAIPLPDGAVDAVTCAQAFHWFADAAALAEIRRVLKPGGALGIVWNTRDETIAWVRRLAQVLQLYEGDAPRHQSGAWRTAFPAEGYGAVHEQRFPHGHAGPVERVIYDRLLSTSYIAALDDARRAEVLAKLQAIVAQTPELAAAEVVVPYVTEAYAVRTLPR